jgi:hypothetical protein
MFTAELLSLRAEKWPEKLKLCRRKQTGKIIFLDYPERAYCDLKMVCCHLVQRKQLERISRSPVL